MAFCTNCGAQLTEGANNCTNCGAAVSAPAAQVNQVVTETVPVVTAEPVTPAPEAGKGMAIAALVCGLVGLLCTGGILNILALIFGIIAKKQGSKSGMATAGIVLGAIGIAFAVIAVVFSIVMGIGMIGAGVGFNSVVDELAGGYYYY